MTDYTGIAQGIAELCKTKKPEIFLIGATILGRSIAPFNSFKNLIQGLLQTAQNLKLLPLRMKKSWLQQDRHSADS